MSNVKFSYSTDGKTAYGSIPDGTEFCIDADMVDIIKDKNFYRCRQGYGNEYLTDCRGIKLHDYLYPHKEGFEIDHINLNTFDNRRCNIRYCTHQQNQINQPLQKNNTSGVSGVSWYAPRRKFRARIKIAQVEIHLGYYRTFEEAVQARNVGMECMFGEFGRYNAVPPAPKWIKVAVIEKCKRFAGLSVCKAFLVSEVADEETLQELIRRLRKAGAKSDATRGCGVHIHIGAKGHTPQSLRNLANIMASHESLLASALNLDRNRMSRYCRTVSKDFLVELNRKKPKTMAELADTWYSSQHANYGRDQHYNDSRYHMLNLHATFTKGTIEFRLFQFDAPSGGKQNGLHAGQLKSYIQLCLALSQLAKQVKTASANPQQTENPKYAMRTWLLRLGFIGDEFKTARELYTKRLDGDTAFRNGRPQ